MNQSITLVNLYYLLRRRIVLILICTIVGAGSLFSYSTFFMPKLYASTANLYVYNSQKVDSQSGSAASQLTINDLALASRLINTYIVMLNNRGIYEEISSKISKSMSASQIAKSVSMSGVGTTEIMRITVKTSDSNLSAEICNEMVKIAPEYLIDKAKVGGVSVLESGSASSIPVSPNIRNNTAVGALLGLIASIGFVLVTFMFDNTVKGEEDVKMRFDVPVLGEIPTLEQSVTGGASRG